MKCVSLTFFVFGVLKPKNREEIDSSQHLTLHKNLVFVTCRDEW